MNKNRRIKNWLEFQHYQSGRNATCQPQWIKLYHKLLDDIEWHELEPITAKTLINLWLLASEYGGTLPPIKTIAFRLRMSVEQIQEILSQLPHWIEGEGLEDAKDTTHNHPRRGSYNHPRPEEEIEIEIEIEKEENIGNGAHAPKKIVSRKEVLKILQTALDEVRANAVWEHRRSLRKPLTLRAAQLLSAEFALAPDPNYAADEMIRNGWQGFKFQWLLNNHSQQAKQMSRTQRASLELIEEADSRANVVQLGTSRRSICDEGNQHVDGELCPATGLSTGVSEATSDPVYGRKQITFETDG